MADNNPYVGPASFGEKERGRFFGRDDEARELSYLLIARPAVLLYAQSGAGKTSLLQAKVVPDLRDSGEMHVLPITRVSGPAEGGNVYIANVLTGLKLTTATLTDALAPRFTDPQDGEEQIPHLLIFDQFEEIFTFRPELASQRREFFEQLRDCLAAYPKLGLLLSMREDYLADMDSFAGYLPDRLRTRMRMERLSDKQAEDAIARPAADAGKPFDAGVARRLADDLRRVQTSRKLSASATDDGHALGKYVEPVQLQIVCSQLWSKLPDDATTITAEHIEALARVDDALTNFYRDSLTAVRAKLPTLSERKLREWFGEHLITSAKTRGMVYQGESDTEELPNAAVEVLREKYILRADIRPSGTWYELAHDRLVEPILADNRDWEALYRNPVKEALKRDPDKLLTGSGLVVALQYRKENPQELDQREQEFLKKSEEEEKRARAWRRRKIGIAAVMLLLLTGALGLAVRTYIESLRSAKFASLLTSRQWAAQSLVELDVRAPRSLLLALNSISLTRQIDAFSPIESRQLLMNLLTASGGLPLKHRAPVVAAAFSPDDRWLVAAGGGDVLIWDLQAPALAPTTLSGHDKVNSLVFTPDGRTLATVGDDGMLRLWDITAADRAASMRVLKGHNRPIVDVAVGPNGRWLATASKDGTARLWDLSAPDPAATSFVLPHEQDRRPVNSLAFSADERWLAIASSDGGASTVRIWELLGSAPSAEPRSVDLRADVRKVAFSPDSQWLVAGATETYQAVLVRVAAPDKQFLLPVDQWVEKVAFSPDGRWLATPSHYDARLWDLTKSDPSSEPLVLRGHRDHVGDLGFSLDGKWFLTAGRDHTVQIWDVAYHFSLSATVRGHEGPITGLAISHDSRSLVTASDDHTLRLWSTSSPSAEPLRLRTPSDSTAMHLWDLRAANKSAPPRVLKGELGSGSGGIFSPDGKWLVTIPRENLPRPTLLHLWNLSMPSAEPHVLRHNWQIWATPVFSRDGRWLITAGVDDPSIKLWDLTAPNPTSNPKLLQGYRGPVRSLAISADGRRLVSGGDDGAAVWDLTADDPRSSLRRLVSSEATGLVSTVAISRNGRYVITGSWAPDYAARIWDLSQSPQASPIKLSFKWRVFHVAVSPDDRWVAAASWDTTAQLLDLAKPGAEPIFLQGHNARTLSVAFSPDSQWLATGNEDRTARLWNLTAADPSADAVVLQAPYKIGNVGFSPDGRWLALNETEQRVSPFSPDGFWFASSDIDTRLYHPRLEDLSELACRTAGRNLKPEESRKGDTSLDMKICPSADQ